MNRLFTYNNKLVSPSSAKVLGDGLPPIAPKTLRFRFYNDFDPTTELSDQSAYGATWTHVTHNIYDWTFNSTDWHLARDPSGSSNTSVWNMYMYRDGSRWVYPMSSRDLDIIDSDLTGVTSVNRLFQGASWVHDCVLKNTSSVADWTSCFYNGNRGCKLSTLNRLDMSGVTDPSNLSTMFGACTYLTGDIILDIPNMTGSFTTAMFVNTKNYFIGPGSFTINMPNCSGSNLSGSNGIIVLTTNTGAYDVPVTLNFGGSVTSLKNFFRGSTGISQVTINGWNTSGVSCQNLFSGCTHLSTINLPSNAKFTGNCASAFQQTPITATPTIDVSDVTDSGYMFYYCTSLETAASYTMPSCTTTQYMFFNCTSLKQVPAITCPAVTNTRNMFNTCTAVESGALDMYNYLSTKATPVTTYTNTFYNCGSDTVTGQAELSQIPSSWGGTGA